MKRNKLILFSTGIVLGCSSLGSASNTLNAWLNPYSKYAAPTTAKLCTIYQNNDIYQDPWNGSVFTYTVSPSQAFTMYYGGTEDSGCHSEMDVNGRWFSSAAPSQVTYKQMLNVSLQVSQGKDCYATASSVTNTFYDVLKANALQNPTVALSPGLAQIYLSVDTANRNCKATIGKHQDYYFISTDRTAPVLNVSPAPVYSNDVVNITASATDDTTQPADIYFEIFEDSLANTLAAGFGTQRAAMDPGVHKILVRARDLSGNTTVYPPSANAGDVTTWGIYAYDALVPASINFTDEPAIITLRGPHFESGARISLDYTEITTAFLDNQHLQGSVKSFYPGNYTVNKGPTLTINAPVPSIQTINQSYVQNQTYIILTDPIYLSFTTKNVMPNTTLHVVDGAGVATDYSLYSCQNGTLSCYQTYNTAVPIANAGMTQFSLITPAPGGGTSPVVSVITYPAAPVLTAITPTGGDASVPFTLTATGNFSPQSDLYAYYNNSPYGSALKAVNTNNTTLTATIDPATAFNNQSMSIVACNARKSGALICSEPRPFALNPPLSFTQQPQNTTWAAGYTTAFNVAATGGTGPGTYRYQWYSCDNKQSSCYLDNFSTIDTAKANGFTLLDPGAFPSATSTSLTFSVTNAQDNTSFLCVVSDQGGQSVLSGKALLAVSQAAFISQNVPLTMLAGKTYPVSVTVKNTGSNTWPVGTSSAQYFDLIPMNPYANATWGTTGVPLLGNIPSGISVTLYFNVTAPAAAGTYNFQWQMIQQGLGPFGDLTPNLSITVNPQIPDGAAFISQTPVPTTMIAGQNYLTSVTMKNTGTNRWVIGNTYYLGAINPTANATWTTQLISMPTNVDPGQNVTFSYTVTAPTTPGIYNLQYQMLHQQVVWFGDPTPNASVTVGIPPSISAQPTDQAAPAGFAAGFSVTAAGSGPLSYQWQVATPGNSTFNNISGAIGATYVTPAVQLQDAGSRYRCVVTSPFGSTLSASATLLLDNATFVSQTVPPSMIAGHVYPVTIVLKNSGTSIWIAGTPSAQLYDLVSMNPYANWTWGVQAVPLSTNIYPGANATLTFNVTAPPATGTYNFQWQMLRQNDGPYGDATPNIAIPVTVVPADGATFVSQSAIPTSMVAGRSYPITIVMKNTGLNTWTKPAGNTHFYDLLSMNPYANSTWLPGAIVGLTQDIPSGSNATFTFNVTAPATPGTYNFQMQMLRQNVGPYGDLTPNVAVTVGVLPTISSQPVDQDIPVGNPAAFSVSVTGAGSLSYQWEVAGPNQSTFSPIDGSKEPSALTPTYITPNSQAVNAGDRYHCVVKSDFGNVTSDAATLFLDNAAFVSQTVPTAMVTGEVHSVTVVMKNTGNSTWKKPTATDQFYDLVSMNPYANGTWGLTAKEISGDIAPGQNATFTFNITAPGTPGTYNFDWAILRQQFRPIGEITPNIAITVATPPADGAQFSSQSLVPTSMTAGKSYPMTVTMKNIGTNTWTAGQAYSLSAINPNGNKTWSAQPIALPNDVGPGQSVSFVYTVTAPATPGIFNFQWQMLHASTWFGETTPNVPISVGTFASVTLTNPANGTSFMTGQAIGLTASVSPGSAAIARVDFYQQDLLIASVLPNAGSTLFTYAWTNVGPGSYFVSAVVVDVNGISSKSNIASITVVDHAGASALAAPIVSFSNPLPLDGTIKVMNSYSVPVTMQWVFTPVASGAQSASQNSSARGPASYSSTAPTLQLKLLNLTPGEYTFSVVAVANSGLSSPTTQNSVTLVGQNALGNLRVFPSPWRADQDAGHDLTIDQVPPNTTIKIYTLSGNWVKTLTADSFGVATWNLTNDSGNKVASNFYVYFAEHDGQKTKGKFAIIR